MQPEHATFIAQIAGAVLLSLPHQTHHMDPAARHPAWQMEWEQITSNMAPVLYCSAALFFSGILCAAAGIGGGGIYVVVLMLVGMLSPHDAVPLSKAVVFFGSLSTLALNLVRMWNPKEGAPKETVIDFTTVRIIAPAALGGTYLGVLFNWHSAGYTIVLLLASILIFMTFMVSRTALKQYREEEQQLAIQRDQHPFEDEQTPLTQGMDKIQSGKGKAVQNQWTKQDTMLCVGLELLVVLSGALRFHMTSCMNELAGLGVPESCTHPVVQLFFGGSLTSILQNQFWASVLSSATTLVPMTACMVLSAYFAKSTLENHKWHTTDIVSYQLMAVFTGCFAGLVGVGGGLIFSPFFLVTGLDPAAAVATSSTCVLFTSSSTTVQYLLTDRVVMSLALAYGLITTIASYAGTSLVHVLQDTFKGRKSYVTGIVVLAVALSAALSLVKVYSILNEPAEVGTTA